MEAPAGRRGNRFFDIYYLIFDFEHREAVGFTMLEAVVVLALLAIIAGIVIANFPALNQRIAIQRSSQELALALRRAQSMALAVRQVQTPGGIQVPPAFGVYVTRSDPARYLIFADLRLGGVNDRRYRAGDDVVVESLSFPPGITITDLRSDVDSANAVQDALNVVFTVPEATVSISNASVSVGSSGRVILGSFALTYTRNVTARISGQISNQ